MIVKSNIFDALFKIGFLLIIGLFSIQTVQAHPLDILYFDIHSNHSNVFFEIGLNPVYIYDLTGSGNELSDSQKEVVFDYFEYNLILENCSFHPIDVIDPTTTNGPSIIQINYSCSYFENLTFTNTLLHDYNYTKTLIVKHNDYQTLLDEYNVGIKIIVKPDNVSFFESVRKFAKLGVEHIFMGYDHIAFILGIILVLVTFKDALWVVTSFTIAHSITLIIAALEIFTFPVIFTEIIIALSIAYVGFENIYFKAKRRWLLAFLFGLFHGFGFSNVLTEIGLPKNHLIASLLSFNIGVELGQLVIVMFALPIIFATRKFKWHDNFVKVSSSIILILGLSWLIERILTLFV